MTPEGKMKIPNLQDMPTHILKYQLSTPENENVLQLTNLTEK